MLGMAGTLATISATMAGASIFVAGWLVLAWLLCMVLVALAAHGRGRSPLLWLALSILLTPLLAGLMLLLFAERPDQRMRRDAQEGRAGLRLCPSCSEVVRMEARRCRFCLADLTRRGEPANTIVPEDRVEPRLQ
jgi:hypothetical protein